MKKLKTLGSLLNYNFITNVATFQFDFVDNIMVEQIQYLLEHKSPIEFSFIELKPFRSRSYQQQKKFWVDFHKIMRTMEIPETKDNCDEFYSFIKKNIFPARKSNIVKNENNEVVDHYYIPEMKDLSMEEMMKVISDLHDYYEFLNIDWSRII